MRRVSRGEEGEQRDAMQWKNECHGEWKEVHGSL